MGKRHPLNMRTTEEIRHKLEAAATLSGRSLVQEVEFRIERSFRDDDVIERLARIEAGMKYHFPPGDAAASVWFSTRAREFHERGRKG